MRLRPAACELVDGVRFGLIVDIDNPEPIPIGLALPRVVRPVVFPEFYGEMWGFDEAVAEPPPDPNLMVGGECGPGPEALHVLQPKDRVARGFLIDRTPKPAMTLDIVASFTQFPPSTPWERRRELACFRLRAEIRGAACSIAEARESPCHPLGAIYLDIGRSVGVSS